MNVCPICFRVIVEGDGIWVRNEKHGLILVHDFPNCTKDAVRLTSRELEEMG